MDKPIVAVDIDEVLVPRAPLILRYLNQRFGGDSLLENMQGESFFGFVVSCFGGQAMPEELSSIIEDYLVSDEYRAVEPIAGAVDDVTTLAQSHRLWILSTRPKSQHPSTYKWLDQYFPGRFEKVVLINEGYFGFNDTKGFSKASFCAENDCGLLIDDRLTACKEMAEELLEAVLFGNCPWNQADSLPGGVVRCDDWPAVLEYFDGRN
ncbi:MAG TPA: hypothetical protein VLF69_01240 [Candidatus Saccharimonadales bacterium]|nr:hypothetical protein [Candidatus Saccharimonadales bacterium]